MFVVYFYKDLLRNCFDLSLKIHFGGSILAPFWALEAGWEVLFATLGSTLGAGPKKSQKMEPLGFLLGSHW